MESRVVVHELIPCLGNGCWSSEHMGVGRHGQDDIDRSDKAKETGDVILHCELTRMVHTDIGCLCFGGLGEYGEASESERRTLFSSQLDSSLLTDQVARVHSAMSKIDSLRHSYRVAVGDRLDRTPTSIGKHNARVISEGGYE